MSARFKALNAAQRTVVVGNGFHTIPNFGLSCSVSLSLSPYVKSPLAPSMSVRSFRALMYEYAYTFVWRTSVLSLVSNRRSGTGKGKASRTEEYAYSYINALKDLTLIL